MRDFEKVKHRFAFGLPRRHVTACRRMERVTAAGPNDGWSIDFMHAELFDGWRTRLLTIVDDFTRESLAIPVGLPEWRAT